MARYHGRKGLVYISTALANAAVAVANLNSWNIDFSTDKVDVTSFLDGNKVSVQGLKGVSGAIGGFWTDNDDTMFVAGDSDTGVNMYLYPSQDAITKYFYGPAWLDASIGTGVTAAVTISANFVAAGTWGRH